MHVLFPSQFPSVLPLDYVHAVRLLKRLPLFTRSNVLKTWVNSWFTSDRVKNGVTLDCFFCLACQEDKLKHYLVCPCLWPVVARITSLSPRSPDPLVRIGLRNPCVENLAIIACLYHGYHFCKAQFSPGMSNLENLSNLCTGFLVHWPEVAHLIDR